MTDNSVGPGGGSRDLLRIEVIDNEIVVSLPKSQLSVTYYKSDKSPQLLAKRIASDDDPRAPMTIQPFTPILLGSQQIANFVQTSLPQSGALLLWLFPILVGAAIWCSRKEEP